MDRIVETRDVAQLTFLSNAMLVYFNLGTAMVAIRVNYIVLFVLIQRIDGTLVLCLQTII